MRLFGIVFASTLCLSAVLSASLSVPAWAQQGQSDEARAELEAVNSAIADIEDWLDRANSRHNDAQETLREAELAVSEIQTEIGEVSARVAESESALNRLRQRQQELEARKDSQAEVLANVMRAAYKTGEFNRLRLLLSGEEPSKAARLMRYAADISRQQLARIEAFETTLGDLRDNRAELDSTLQILEEQQAELEAQSAELATARDERESALSALSADINSRSGQLEQLQFDQAELQALLEEIARAMEGIRSFADVPAITANRGRLNRPVDGAVTARFGSSYGGGSLQRQGIILSASEGSPVQAVHPGQVVFADWLRGAGLLVIVDHGGGTMSLYGGNEALASSAGDWVDTGDVLATSGLGGENGSPGLYFEIRQNGSPQDPEEWLAGGR